MGLRPTDDDEKRSDIPYGSPASPLNGHFYWDTATDNLAPVRQNYAFKSKPVESMLADVFERLAAQL